MCPRWHILSSLGNVASVSSSSICTSRKIMHSSFPSVRQHPQTRKIRRRLFLIFIAESITESSPFTFPHCCPLPSACPTPSLHHSVVYPWTMHVLWLISSHPSLASWGKFPGFDIWESSHRVAGPLPDFTLKLPPTLHIKFPIIL